MSRQCTICHITRELSFFQPRHATIDESLLLRTCSICRNRRRRTQNIRQLQNTRQLQATSTELNTTVATTGQHLQISNSPSGTFGFDLPHPGLPPPDIAPGLLLPAVLPRRRRRLSVHSDTSFQREHGFANRVELNASSIPLAFNNSTNHVYRTRRLDLGGMTIECEYCHALHWPSEPLRGSGLTSTIFEKCCKKGIVPLSPFKDPPVDLQHLLTGDEQ